MQPAQPFFHRVVYQAVVDRAGCLPSSCHRLSQLFSPGRVIHKNCTITAQMRTYEFDMDLSAAKTRSIYEGQACYILVESDQGLKLQLPAANFRDYVTADGIQGRFNVKIDASNKIIELRKL